MEAGGSRAGLTTGGCLPVELTPTVFISMDSEKHFVSKQHFVFKVLFFFAFLGCAAAGARAEGAL